MYGLRNPHQFFQVNSPQKKRGRQGSNRGIPQKRMDFMDSHLTGKNVLITGASGGIGGEVVRAFHREGARVIAHFSKHRQRAEALAAELGDNCRALGADLTQESAVEQLFSEAEAANGPVAILVANHGYWPPDDMPIEQMSLEQWNSTLAVNLTSVFLCMRRFLRGIRAHQLREPAAVLIGSTAALFGEAGHGDYAAAKAGLTYGLTRTLKNEIARLAPRGRVNVVCPGWTFTPMTRRFADDKEKVRRVLQTIPLRKVARAQDVANAVVYLASSELAGHISGQILTVAGGMEGRMLYHPEEINPENGGHS